MTFAKFLEKIGEAVESVAHAAVQWLVYEFGVLRRLITGADG